jgi:3-methyladenine DNA glycosylase AlkD
MFNKQKYVSSVINCFEQNKNPSNALPMKKYMKDRFEFFGIKSPLRKEISKPFLRKEALPEKDALEEVVKLLWSVPQRELQYFTIALLEKFTKRFEKNNIDLLEYLVVTKSWWDSVDGIAINIVGPFFRSFPELIESKTLEWINSENFWLQRTAILFQLKYKNETNTKLLFKYIKQLSNEKEFFIRKAIGWALREYSKSNPEFVLKFVNSNKLSKLSEYEALRLIK